MSNTLDNSRPDRTSAATAPDCPAWEVEITVDPAISPAVDDQRLRQAVLAAARHQNFNTGHIGIRVTDDATIQGLNRKHMGHDYPTDVISFGYTCQRPRLEGEMVVSHQTAQQKAADLGWSLECELLLYVIHGTLHITGMDDQQPQRRSQMRQAEHEVLTELGIKNAAVYGADASAETAGLPSEEELS
ncbi:MAG: rRNA maturation RNase YbeY [Pirellulales bacterium]|nr:rRNA maturation RNase YbeY [Pirellulales bacterium]